jgi:hypothetical protein
MKPEVYCLFKLNGWTGIEYSDVVVLVGLGFIGVGLWMFAPWVSLTTLGTLILLLSIRRR